MDCEKIREKLSGHAEGLLPKDEAARVEEHLASCAECRQAYGDLLKTIAHLRNLEEVSPPEWFTAKIMARVKDETAQRKRGWKEFFRPFPVKLPLGAVATVLIAMAALYIYQANRSATTMLPAGHPEVTMQPFRQDKGAEEKRKTEEQTTAAPQRAEKKEAPAPRRPEAPPAKALRDAEQGFGSTLSEAGRGGSVKEPQQVPLQAVPRAKALGEAQKERAIGSSGAERGGPINAPQPMLQAEPKQHTGEDRMLRKSSPGAVGSSATPAPAPSRLSRGEKEEAAATAPSAKPVFTLGVADAVRAGEEISRLLRHLNGRIISKSSHDGKTTIDGELDVSKFPELREELKKIGEVRVKGLSAEAGSGRVSITIELLEHPGRD